MLARVCLLLSLTLSVLASCEGADSATNEMPPGIGGNPEAEAKALGQRCERDGDCGGLHCLGADRDYQPGQGAPPHGICTVDCQIDEDCQAFAGGALCASLAETPLVRAEPTGRKVCVLGCSLGLPTGPDKCLARNEFACRYFARWPLRTCRKDGAPCDDGAWCFQGYCRETGCGPRCNSDGDCDAGRFCNALTGLCDEQRGVDVPLAKECDLSDASHAACGSGMCVTFETAGAPTKEQCTLTCTLGEPCGSGGVCSQPRFLSYARGDIGYCIAACDCDKPCSRPEDRCLRWGNDALAQQFGSEGYCDVPVLNADVLDCDPAASAGGAGNRNDDGQAGAH